ncbi:MAG: hypothetical protein M3Y69_07095 [Verrucomicrobiota bacterium]|nr:hypothetical protein [Verrucomicrobiota bacterium]
METGVQFAKPIRLQAAQAGWPEAVHDRSTTVMAPDGEAPENMARKSNVLRAIGAGFLLTFVQLFVVVVLIAPEGPLVYRYETLVQHDSYWFANIIERGYDSILPPITRKMMEVSNVAFFPAYPTIAGAVHKWGGLSIYDAMLVTAQLAAWGFWSYFFLFCDRWNIRPLRQFCGALAIAAHPTAFFLIAAYSESLFLMALFGFIYWSTGEGRTAKILAAVHGIVMSATRIVGIPCALFPMVRAFFEGGWKRVRNLPSFMRHHVSAVVLSFSAMLGAIGFFIYCLVRWGRWDLYMQTQSAGWAIVPDYLAVFKLSSYRWLIPPLDDPTQASQMTMTLGAISFVVIALVELLPALRQRTAWQTRMGLYFCAFITYYIAVSGVASVQMESMLRYQFCAHALIVLALLHFLAQFHNPPVLARAFGIAAIVLLSAAALGLQGWYVWNFTRGGWVA